MSEFPQNPCEGKSMDIFDSVASFDSEATKEAARICAQCAVAAECRNQLSDDTYHENFLLPTVIAGVYISRGGARQVVDTTSNPNTIVRSKTEISYGEYIDNDNPRTLIGGLRELLREEKVTLRGGTGDPRLRELLGYDAETMTTEEYVALRHYKALDRARFKGFLLDEVPTAFKRTIDCVIEDYEEIAKIAGAEAAAAAVTYHGPEDLAEFFELAEDGDEITRYQTTSFLRGVPKNPQESLSRYRQNMQLVQEAFEESFDEMGVSQHHIRKLVIDNPKRPVQAASDYLDRIKQIQQRIRNGRAVKPHIISNIAASNPDTFPQALYRFETLFEDLETQFGDRGLDDTTIRRIALGNPNDAHEKAEIVLQNQSELNSKYAGRNGVAEGVIRYFARLYNDPEAAMETYLSNIEYIHQNYPHFPSETIYGIAKQLKSCSVIADKIALAHEQLSSSYDMPECTEQAKWFIASHYFDSPEQTMSTYLQNLDYLRERYSRYRISEDYLREAALSNLNNPDKSMRRRLRFMGVVADRSGETSLNKPIGEDAELIDFVRGGISAENDYFQQLYHSGITQRVDAILHRLTPRQQRALELYYGFMEPEETEVMPRQGEVEQIISDIREGRL